MGISFTVDILRNKFLSRSLHQNVFKITVVWWRVSVSPAIIFQRMQTGYNLKFTKVSYIRNCCMFMVPSMIWDTMTRQTWHRCLALCIVQWKRNDNTFIVHTITIQMYNIGCCEGSGKFTLTNMWRKIRKSVFWVFFCFATMLRGKLVMSFCSDFLVFLLLLGYI